MKNGAWECKAGLWDTGMDTGVFGNEWDRLQCTPDNGCAKRVNAFANSVLPRGKKLRNGVKPGGATVMKPGKIPTMVASRIPNMPIGKDANGKSLYCAKPCKRRGYCTPGRAAYNKGLCCKGPWASKGFCAKPRTGIA